MFRNGFAHGGVFDELITFTSDDGRWTMDNGLWSIVFGLPTVFDKRQNIILRDPSIQTRTCT